MLHLIADLNLNSEGGREGGRTGETGQAGSEDGHTQAEVVCGKCFNLFKRKVQNGRESTLQTHSRTFLLILQPKGKKPI